MPCRASGGERALPGCTASHFAVKSSLFSPSAVQASTSDREILSFLPLPISSHLGPPPESNTGHFHMGKEI